MIITKCRQELDIKNDHESSQADVSEFGSLN